MKRTLKLRFPYIQWGDFLYASDEQERWDTADYNLQHLAGVCSDGIISGLEVSYDSASLELVVSPGAVLIGGIYAEVAETERITDTISPGIVITNDTEGAPHGVVAADAVRLMYMRSEIVADVITDDADATFSDTWENGIHPTAYGSAYRWCMELPTDNFHTAGYPLEVLTAGIYDVYAWYKAHISSSSNVPYIIRQGNSQETTVYVNQQENGGAWYKIAEELPFTIANIPFYVYAALTGTSPEDQSLLIALQEEEPLQEDGKILLAKVEFN